MRIKKKLLLPVVFFTIFTLILGAPLTAFAATPLKIALKYNDDMMIDYDLGYPPGYSPGGATLYAGDEGPAERGVRADVPFGGVKTDPGDVVVAKQIYCIDPFTPFHGQLPGLGGEQSGDGNGYTDSISGYVVAAPWHIPDNANLKYNNALLWLVYNGYRGDFISTSSSGDLESQQQVQALKDLYDSDSSTGKIDSGTVPPNKFKEIALMATKIAIWDIVVEGRVGGTFEFIDAVKFDDDEEKILRLLIDLMIADAKARDPQGPQTTSLSLTIDDKSATRTSIGSRSFYGPLRVDAALKNGVSATLLDRVYLENNRGYKFVEILSGNTIRDLDSDLNYGTDKNMQYLDGDTLPWTNGQLYVEVPTGWDRSITVSAYAGALEAEVVKGTPLVFVYEELDTGVYDWNAIQAFIGAAEGPADLFAEAKMNISPPSGNRPPRPPGGPDEPGEPEEPEEPNKPNEPEEPEIPNKPQVPGDPPTTIGNDDPPGGGTDVPPTGVGSAVVCAILLLMSATVMAFAVLRRRDK